jgi:hypothetical protein
MSFHVIPPPQVTIAGVSGTSVISGTASGEVQLTELLLRIVDSLTGMTLAEDVVPLSGTSSEWSSTALTELLDTVAYPIGAAFSVMAWATDSAGNVSIPVGTEHTFTPGVTLTGVWQVSQNVNGAVTLNDNPGSFIYGSTGTLCLNPNQHISSRDQMRISVNSDAGAITAFPLPGNALCQRNGQTPNSVTIQAQSELTKCVDKDTVNAWIDGSRQKLSSPDATLPVKILVPTSVERIGASLSPGDPFGYTVYVRFVGPQGMDLTKILTREKVDQPTFLSVNNVPLPLCNETLTNLDPGEQNTDPVPIGSPDGRPLSLDRMSLGPRSRLARTLNCGNAVRQRIFAGGCVFIHNIGLGLGKTAIN